MKINRIFLIIGNERYGEVLRSRLGENLDTADVHSVDAVETEDLTGDDVIVLDAHIVQPKQACRGVRRVRVVREQDLGTPFVILTWLSRSDIVNSQLASNPFVGKSYQDSCRFLRLPVSTQQLMKTLEKIQPCTEEMINEGKRFLDHIDRVHRTSLH